MVLAPKNTDTHTSLTRAQEIAEAMARQIVRGDLVPGERLPAERELAVQYGATRNVIREALKRLESVGLLQSRRGSGAYVQKLEFTGAIELFDLLLTDEDGNLDVPFLRDTLEFRGYVIRLIVRLAAARCTEEELVEGRRLLEVRSGFLDNRERYTELTRELFNCVASATHNVVCILMFRTVERVSMRLGTLIDLPTLGTEQSQDVFRRLFDAFERHDSAMAELVVIRYIESIEKAFSAAPSPKGFLSI